MVLYGNLSREMIYVEQLSFIIIAVEDADPELDPDP
jgi:hypothetical protein